MDDERALLLSAPLEGCPCHILRGMRGGPIRVDNRVFCNEACQRFSALPKAERTILSAISIVRELRR